MSAGASILPGLFRVSLVSGVPAVISDGNTVGWYLADDLTTITKDGSNFVSQWNDKLASGHNLLQATGTNQPLWVTPGTIRFDGVDNFMKTAAFTWNQPEYIYLLFKQITWTINDTFFDGVTDTYGFLRQATTTPGFLAYAGNSSGLDSQLALDTWGIVRVFFNGASSKLQVNATSPVAPNPFNCGASNMGAFALGTRGNVSSRFSNIEVKEIILRKVADSSGDETAIYNYLVTRLP